MLDYSSLPDLLALTVLVFVFWSILRTRVCGQLHAWLVGWIFILLHFAVGLFGGRPGNLRTFVQCLAAIMLALGGAAFIDAAGGAKWTSRIRFLAGVGLSGAVLYIILDSRTVS